MAVVKYWPLWWRVTDIRYQIWVKVEVSDIDKSGVCGTSTEGFSKSKWKGEGRNAVGWWEGGCVCGVGVSLKVES